MLTDALRNCRHPQQPGVTRSSFVSFSFILFYYRHPQQPGLTSFSFVSFSFILFYYRHPQQPGLSSFSFISFSFAHAKLAVGLAAACAIMH
jgi:hypothetical protein